MSLININNSLLALAALISILVLILEVEYQKLCVDGWRGR